MIVTKESAATVGMKALCRKSHLLEAIAPAVSVTPIRAHNPASRCFRISVSADHFLHISATDHEMSVRATCVLGDAGEVGSAIVPAEKFRDIINAIPDDMISMELHGKALYINGHKSRFKLYAERKFPDPHQWDGKEDLAIEPSILKSLIRQTVFAAAKKATRYSFNAALLTVSGRSICFVATDGRRLATARGDVINARENVKTIVPAAALKTVEKYLPDDEVVSVRIQNDEFVVFHTPSVTLIANICEGKFPPYEDVIPKDTSHKITVETADFLSAVRQAAIFNDDARDFVHISCSKNRVALTGRNPEDGEATIELPCKYEGQGIDIGFRSEFLTSALEVTDADQVTFEFTEPNRHGLLRAGHNFLYVTMPVNIA